MATTSTPWHWGLDDEVLERLGAEHRSQLLAVRHNLVNTYDRMGETGRAETMFLLALETAEDAGTQTSTAMLRCRRPITDKSPRPSKPGSRPAQANKHRSRVEGQPAAGHR